MNRHVSHDNLMPKAKAKYIGVDSIVARHLCNEGQGNEVCDATGDKED